MAVMAFSLMLEVIWVWQGRGASKAEKAMWMDVAQEYRRRLQGGKESVDVHLASIVEGSESLAFFRAVGVVG